MNANDRFEVMAEKFYKETGIVAPGKDCPAEFSDHSYDQRVNAWRKWAEKFYSDLFSKNFALPE